LHDVNYVYKTLSFVDLQKKLEVVKRKIEVSYRFGFSNEYEQFAQTHNHDHDEDGGHADHVENGTHVRTAPTEKQLDSLLNKFKVSEEHASLEDLLSKMEGE
jgi:hypothetical protein